ncbi:MAG: hypothetical protein K0S74_1589 [Chlamydiales bacterium]|jgi:hypothetical protein|nr:hypothetical protein [Chlamydiales bacterium]
MNNVNTLNNFVSTLDAHLNELEMNFKNENSSSWFSYVPLKSYYTPNYSHIIRSSYEKISRQLDEIEAYSNILDSQTLCRITDKGLDCLAREAILAKQPDTARLLQISSKTRDEVSRKLVAVQYRRELIKEEEVKIAQEVLEPLLMDLMDWKKAQGKVFAEPELTEKDRAVMNCLAKYPKFVQMAAKSHAIAHSLFRWAIKYHNPIDVFVEFPHAQKIIESHPRLMHRIGYYGGKHLTIEKVNCVKQVCLELYYHGKHNLLDKTTKLCYQEFNYTINDILRDFRNKDNKPGEFELFADGINYWEADKIYDPIYMGSPYLEWWERLPVLQTLNQEQLQLKYNLTSEQIIQNGTLQWIFSVGSVSVNDDLGFGEAHAYLEVAIPTEEGDYTVYPFSIYPAEFAQTTWQKLSFTAQTFPAKIYYPDPWIFNLGTPHYYKAYPIDPAKGFTAMQGFILSQINKGKPNGRNPGLAYQRLVHNCAYWVTEVFEKALGIQLKTTDEPDAPHLFKINYMAMEPKEEGKTAVFNAIKGLSPWWQDQVATTIYTMLGSKWLGGKEIELTIQEGTTEKVVSLWDKRPWAVGGYMYHPANGIYRKAMTRSKL